ncbi:Uncharacterised protein [Anaerobiospirillum thomasii]|uniref:hypothetical protein n=1 Tax=Anaerobiospirillum thomasii TaxID=179995 RepID=UPI000D863592|nr:hypothetical protein [Anaerobiospirillum thomasii]SPT71302.1 Uncharacterised protein [Anaerobiospirillum thomasii]
MKYRIGWPGWKVAYKLGFTMTYKVSFEYSLADDEFQNEEGNLYTYTGYFDDLDLAFEALTFEELIKEAQSIANEYVEMQCKTDKLSSKIQPILPQHIKGLV